MAETLPEPTPEGAFIRELRERAPRMSGHEAARQAAKITSTGKFSESRWRQVENGVRWFRGTPYPETGPAQTIAAMALAVGLRHMKPRELARELTALGRGDAAAELEVLAAQVEHRTRLTARQSGRLIHRVGDDMMDDG